MVPRFLWSLLDGEPRPPFGISTWQATRVSLPASLAQTRFINVFTGDTVRAFAHRGAVWLLAGDAFSSWPVAVLISA
jgi:hypothetical protein